MINAGKPDDNAIFSKLKAGDKSAMRELYALYGDYVYTIAYSVTGSQQDASEVTQDTFVKIWKSAHTYDADKSSLRTWIAKIARNTAIDIARKSTPTPAGDNLDLLLSIISDKHTPEESAIENQEAERVKSAIRKLPEPQQEVLLLAYFHSMSQSEIAAKCKIPLGTVKSRMRTGLTTLKELLE
jgi:RNA polymerase sigma-70 factor (ECF subfamily)